MYTIVYINVSRWVSETFDHTFSKLSRVFPEFPTIFFSFFSNKQKFFFRYEKFCFISSENIELLDNSTKEVIPKGAILARYRNYINDNLYTHSTFLHILLNLLNQWIRHCAISENLWVIYVTPYNWWSWRMGRIQKTY